MYGQEYQKPWLAQSLQVSEHQCDDRLANFAALDLGEELCENGNRQFHEVSDKDISEIKGEKISVQQTITLLS